MDFLMYITTNQTPDGKCRRWGVCLKKFLSRFWFQSLSNEKYSDWKFSNSDIWRGWIR